LAAIRGSDAFAEGVCGAIDNNCPPSLTCLTKPNFTIANPAEPKMLARYRPHREISYRLETPPPIGGKFFVHNYGHSGAGITMSLGCAEFVVREVEKIIAQNGKDIVKDGIAVLGGGVMGLTAAAALVKRFDPTVQVDIFAKDWFEKTTSYVAGGQWAPSSVKWKEDDTAENEKFKTILASSLSQFRFLTGPYYGVWPRTNYTLSDDDNTGLERAHRLGLITRRTMPRLPFAGMNCSGYAYDTLLVEPPVFLARLHAYLKARLTDQHMKQRTFANPASGQHISQHIMQLSQKVIVNCTGYAAGALFTDCHVKAKKGQLLLLPAQPLNYMFSGFSSDDGDWTQYVFPRRDYLIVGGTYQDDPHHEQPNRAVGVQFSVGLTKLFKNSETVFPDKTPNQLDAEMHLPEDHFSQCD
jgi:hypothetical protein